MYVTDWLYNGFHGTMAILIWVWESNQLIKPAKLLCKFPGVVWRVHWTFVYAMLLWCPHWYTYIELKTRNGAQKRPQTEFHCKPTQRVFAYRNICVSLLTPIGTKQDSMIIAQHETMNWYEQQLSCSARCQSINFTKKSKWIDIN